MDIALTIKKLVEGIGDTELDKIANVIVDRYSKVKGIDYILIPKDKSHQSTFVTATKQRIQTIMCLAIWVKLISICSLNSRFF